MTSRNKYGVYMTGTPKTATFEGQDFQLAEVLVWSSALTTEEIGKVEAHLSARYGITLSN